MMGGNGTMGRPCQTDGRVEGWLLAGSDGQGRKSVPVFSFIAGNDPHGDDALRATSAVAGAVGRMRTRLQ